MTYVDGDTVTADVFRFANPTAASLALEWKVWLGVPGIPSIGVVNLGADGSFVLPAGTDVDLGPLTILPVTAALPPGSYEFSCRMLDPVTGELLVEDRNIFCTNGNIFCTNADTEVVEIVGSKLERIYADPNRPVIYVSDSANNSVHVINTSTNTLSESIPVGSQPTKMDMDSSAQYLFVMNSGGSNVSVISADTRMVVDTINLSDVPDSIAVSSADHLYISMRNNGASPDIVSYDVSSIPATVLFSDDVSLIITGRSSDHTQFYMHGWSTSLDTPLWDVTASPPVTIGSSNISSGATTITPIWGTELVMVSPAFEYWDARFPNSDGDMPIYKVLVIEATVNVEWTVTAAAASLSGANFAVAHGQSVTNPTTPVEDRHIRSPDLHIFSANNFVEIETLVLSDWVLHNGLSYAANGDIYFLKGESVSSSVSVIDR